MTVPVVLVKPKMSSGELAMRLAGLMARPPIILLPSEREHPITASHWALACLKLNASTLAETDPYGGTEVGILDDQVWFTRYLIALARLTLEGRQKVDAARGDTMEGAS